MRAMLLLALSSFLVCLGIAVVAGPPQPASAAVAGAQGLAGRGHLAEWQRVWNGTNESRQVVAPVRVAVIDNRLTSAATDELGNRVIWRQDMAWARWRVRGTQYPHALYVANALAGATSGACPTCLVISLGVMRADRPGGSEYTDLRTIGMAIDRAARLGARVINLSLTSPVACSRQLNASIARAISKGIVVVAATGNDPSQAVIGCPASARDVISVGAMTLQQTATPTYPNQTISPTIWAAGGNVVGLGQNATDTISGTGSSFAAPLVAGLLAARIAQVGAPRNAAGVRALTAELRASAMIVDGRPVADGAALLGLGRSRAVWQFIPAGRPDIPALVLDQRGPGELTVCAPGERLQVLNTWITGAPGAATAEEHSEGLSRVQTGPQEPGWHYVDRITLRNGGAARAIFTTQLSLAAGQRLITTDDPGDCARR